MKAALVLASCAACALGGHRPNYQYYVISSQAPPSASVRSDRIAPALTVTVKIPGYLDREQIATRTGPHVTYSTTDRWAEPLDQAFERTLREDLAAQLRQRGIQVAAHAANASYELAVDVMRFERSAADRVELWARWTLRVGTNVVDGGVTRMQVATRATDSASAAAALSDAIAGMARDVAGRVQQADVVATRPSKNRPAK